MVTTGTDPPLERYNCYVRGGESEQWVDELKRARFTDRLSCHAFWANQFRLLLFAAAYVLLDTLRRLLMASGVPRMRLDTQAASAGSALTPWIIRARCVRPLPAPWAREELESREVQAPRSQLSPGILWRIYLTARSAPLCSRS